ncbi:MAG: VWA domain-containing protein [Candidatus Aminicenantes bacterium]|nr:MAG: VWA domain-containing protein [Candidatus Aminicenantes bacterium]
MIREKFFTSIIIVLLLTVTFTSSLGHAQPAQGPGVVFLSPKQDALWTGKQQIKIELIDINPEEVRLVELYLDGRLLKEFAGPPYILTHQFGTEGQNRTLKVVVRDEALKLLAAAALKSYQVHQSHKVEVQRVLVPVVVKDKKGNYVRGLKKEDFLLSSDGKPINISYLSTRGTERFNMVQVIDVSYSMRDKIHDVLLASQDFATELMTERDRATFVFFNQRVYDHMGFTSNLSELVERLDLRAPVMGGTALYDAAAYTLNLMSKTPGWNIMVIFSDGGDNSSYIDPFSLVNKVKKSPVVIYAIDNRHSGFNNVLGEICSLTGGMLFPLMDARKTNKVYEKIREEIKAQYILYFNPGSSGGPRTFKRFHSLSVRVKNHDDYDIRAIKGYYY